jgi:general secretion pathway protein D
VLGRQVFVYRAQNAKATELAEILGQIFQGGGTLSAGANAPGTLAPGLTPALVGSSAPTSGPGPDTGLPSIATGISVPPGNSVEIIADDVRNALVVLASPQEYKMVEAAVRQLDTVPLQVLIEASILEVTLNDDLSYGIEWFFKNNLGGNNEKTGRGLLDLGPAGLSPLAPSFSYTIIDSADQVRTVLNALAAESEINVLSTPSLMVLDNQRATINVGDEIPVPSRQSISNLDPDAPTVNEVQFRKTGITLNVTPRVNNSGLVTMEIAQEVATAIATTTSDIDAPTIQNRAIESVVAINSGETIVLGGLIQDTRTKRESGVPVLHKIPILGAAFGLKSHDQARTELLVLLTPRVVRNRQDARQVTEELKQKLRGLDFTRDRRALDGSESL